MKRRLWAAGLGGMALVLGLYWKEWPRSQATVVSLMVAVLSYSGVTAIARLRQLYRRNARVE